MAIKVPMAIVVWNDEMNNGEHPGESSITFLPMSYMDPGDMSCHYSLFNTFVCFCRGIITQCNACGNIRSATVVEKH